MRIRADSDVWIYVGQARAVTTERHVGQLQAVLGVYHAAMGMGAKALFVLTACQRAAEVLPGRLTTANRRIARLPALRADVSSAM